MKRLLAALLALSFAGAIAPVRADEPDAPARPPAQKTPAVPSAVPDAVTHHSVTVDGRAIAYTARAGTITLHNDKDQPTARMFYTAYTA
ncbi:MAG: peptidase S10, partial [Candidatus Eremiobacteraeota bacterium]|nr:peptidase S10 [Candidatus Eremiobacteraeota bacterium]